MMNPRSHIKYLRRGIIWTLVGMVIALPVYYLKLEKELYILAGGFGIFGILQLISAGMIKSRKEQKRTGVHHH